MTTHLTLVYSSNQTSSADITTAHLRTLAKTAIQSKLPPSMKTQTAIALLEMFIQLFVAEGEITVGFELLSQFITHPVMAQEPSLSAALAILSCMEVIRFVHQTKPSLLLAVSEFSEGTTMGIKREDSDGDRDSSSSGEDDSDEDEAAGDRYKPRRDDFPELEVSRVTSALLCPSCDDVVANPFQFHSSVDLLQQFSKIRTSQQIQ